MGYPVKGEADYLEVGTWNVECSMCGKKLKASQVVKNWMGMYRCPQHNEPRQPQDFVRAIPERVTPPFVQHPGDADYVHYCSLDSSSAVPGYAEPGCMIPNNPRIPTV